MTEYEHSVRWFYLRANLVPFKMYYGENYLDIIKQTNAQFDRKGDVEIVELR